MNDRTPEAATAKVAVLAPIVRDALRNAGIGDFNLVAKSVAIRLLRDERFFGVLTPVAPEVPTAGQCEARISAGLQAGTRCSRRGWWHVCGVHVKHDGGATVKLTREQEIEIIVRGLRDRQPDEPDEELAGRIIDDFARTTAATRTPEPPDSAVSASAFTSADATTPYQSPEPPDSGDGGIDAALLARADVLADFAGRFLAGDSDVQPEDVRAAIDDYRMARRSGSPAPEGRPMPITLTGNDIEAGTGLHQTGGIESAPEGGE